jgi:hypothetical protein
VCERGRERERGCVDISTLCNYVFTSLRTVSTYRISMSTQISYDDLDMVESERVEMFIRFRCTVSRHCTLVIRMNPYHCTRYAYCVIIYAVRDMSFSYQQKTVIRVIK